MSRKTFFLPVDLGLLVPAVVLVVLSLATLFSIQSSLFRNQFFIFLASVVAFIFFSHINVHVLKKYSIVIYGVSVVLLLLLLFLGIEARGAVRWVDIFGIRFQFSEILKPFLAFSLASFLSTRQPDFRTLVVSILLLLPIVFLIFLQPDLGSALVYAFATCIVFLVYGFSWVWFVLGAGAAALSTPLLWQFLRDYQKQRILTFLNPSSDPLGTSYNVIQSVIAVGSGQFFGRGLNESTQSGLRFLPEHHTDFIFATLTEGLGFVGALIILASFGFLFYRIYMIFVYSDNPLGKLMAVFVFAILMTQVVFNIGMNVGLLPVVGITLPFVSYGGSSLLANFILLGLLSSVNSKEGHSRVLEIG